MFTGIVELLAPIIEISPQDLTKSGGGGYSMTIGKTASILKDCHIGDSIAVNGTCLTVTEFDASESVHGGYFKIGVAPETLKKTNLGQLKVGDGVNCERAMDAHTRFGGHFVQGHVDTTAIIRSIVPNANALTITLRLQHKPDSLPLPSSLSPYLIPKGYVTLDGASLTLIEVSPATGGLLPSNTTAGELRQDVQTPKKEIVEFNVMLIAHTQEVIGLSKKKPGDTVNVELDMVGKYVHRAVLGSLERDAEEHADQVSNSVDAGREIVGTAVGPASSQALEGMVDRIVRKVLSEQK
uniref:Related to RIB5-riboflavin synthase, alpha chain n=1 Tax=Melanopsichium pennsylvanicum 4 TaxID=1398559 RepID=A0A077R1E7_9BASI|nr:related to RIB5-riboflavin synthase, alpha chain [Melanopsichium pennsylvanicum 4]